MKSNISIRSNIYIRSSDNISRDQNYVSQVRGRELIKQIKSKYCLPFSSVRLSPWQEEVYKIGVTCAYAKNNEITHGMVKKDGINAWKVDVNILIVFVFLHASPKQPMFGRKNLLMLKTLKKNIRLQKQEKRF